jgi:hypothetical protein
LLNSMIQNKMYQKTEQVQQMWFWHCSKCKWELGRPVSTTSRLQTPSRTEILLFTLRSTQPPIQWVPGAPFSWGKAV